MVEYKRKKGESFEAFLRRFNKTLQLTGKLFEARKRKYLAPNRNKAKQKAYALVSNKMRAKRDYLRKIGKLPENGKLPKK